MCGIAGVLGHGRPGELEALLGRMSDSLRHRGPDDHGAWVDHDSAIGARRLAIIDLAHGQQPMWTRDGSFGIVFNGEIYNHAALRTRLEADGVAFRTRSDTEVLLRVLCRDGIAGLAAVNGMFAACLLDRRERSALLVRDRLGKKPLYYGSPGGRLLFASELKAILAALPRRPELNLQAIHDYLSLRYVPGPDTIWQGLSKLAPGHALRVDLATGREELERWWSVDVVAEPANPGRDYVAELEAMLLEAVEERLVAADVPVGVMLSGGLDSSAVSAAAVRLGHRAFHTFAVGYEGGGLHSELRHARTVAEHLGSRHHELRVAATDFAEGLSDLVWQTDEPLADLAAVPLYRLSLLAREHVKVVLSGEGADEVLAGYSFEQMAAGFERMRRVAALPGPLLRAAGRAVPGPRGDALQALGSGGRAGYPAAMGTHISWVLGESDKEALWRHAPGARPTEKLLAGWYGACPSPDPLDRVQQVAMGSWLVEDLLMKADKSTMAASLELRCPFLAHRLVEWGVGLPTAWKVGNAKVGWSSKRALRVLAARWLPAAIVERPKQGFPVPAYDWLRAEGGAWADERLARDDGAFAEHFDPSALLPALRAARAGDGPSAQRVWLGLVLQEWMDRWL
jgi:asparagine synthase (glutamine-hydrolysing)